MVVYNNVLAGAAGSGGDGYKIERSLRFNSADTAQLSTRFLSFTDINTGTISFWVKRSGLGAGVIAAGWDGGVSYSGSIQFNSSDNCLQVSMGGSASHTFKTQAALRDVSSWYHVVAAWNRSASAADKVKVWINGVAQTSSDTGYQSWTSGDCQIWAANTGNRIGRGDADRYTNQLNGYLAEYHYVDGQALDETSFGEYDNNGVWQPKDCKDDLTYGTAGFYLSFSDTSTNSALGLDQSPGRTQDPTATTYGLITGGSVANVFDGVASYTSELSMRPNGSGVTLDTPVTASTSVRIYGSSERTSVARYQINGSNTSAVPTTYPNRGWTTISGLTFPITISSFGVGGAQADDGARLSAIEIDGTVLTGTANNWTVSNMSAPTGAAVTISEAAGALPIRNTTGDQGGTAASGFRTDANASSLFLALPLNTNTSDVSNSINSNSTTKSTTNQSTTTSSSQSKFYGASSYWNANSDGILVAQSGSELVLGTGDFTIELWFRDDSNHSGGGSGRCYLFDNRIGGSIVGDPPTLIGYVDGSSTISYGASGGGTISHSLSTDNKWIHFAAVRNSSTTTFYINGTSVGSHGDTTNYTNNGFGIGRATDGGYGWAGYIQDFRVYKTAKYTSNFSVPAGPDTSVGAACDSLIDSPTDYEADSGNNGGNYCTLNVLDKRSTVTLSNGNLDATTSTSHWSGVKGTIGVSSGKYYYEVTYGDGNAGRIFVGICGHDVDIDPNSYVQDDTTERAKGMLLFCDDGRYQLDTASRVNMTSQPVSGDVIGVAFDLDNNTAQFYKNGTALGSIDISGSTLASTTVVPIVVVYQSGVNHNFNAGQRPFAYPVSGYSTLCTTNLPDPLIADPTTVFDSVAYTGNGSSKTISGVGFSPDLIWTKCRNQARSHYLMDTVRGISKYLITDQTSAEGTNTTNRILSVTSDGWTLGTNNSFNGNNDTYVAWTWDAGESTTTVAAGGLNSSAYFMSQTWSNGLTGLSNSSITAAANAFNGNENDYADSTAGFTLDLSGHTFGTGTHTIELKSGGASSFTVNGSTSLSTTGSGGAIVWTGTHTGELTSLASSATGASLYYLKIDGKFLINYNTSVPKNFPTIATTTRANPTAGFSIVNASVAASLTGGPTLAHGLNKKPEFIIGKNRDSTIYWYAYHKDLTENHYLIPHLANAQANSGAVWGSHSSLDSNVFQIGAGTPASMWIPSGTNDCIFYVWTAVDGYSAFGSFEGDGQSEGPFVHTGFEVAFLLCKSADTGYDWFIYDTARQSYNEQGPDIRANRDYAEQNSPRFDFLSNGFKVHTSSVANNASNVTYIWAAFASNPFKFARAA